jgi:hypothetical protein
MPVYIACDKCQKRLKIPEDVIGRSIKCPSCGSVFKADPAKAAAAVAPAPTPAPKHSAPAALEDEPDDVVPPPRRPAALDDEDDDMPKPRKKAAALDENEEAEATPRKKAAALDEDEEVAVTPRKKPAAPAAEDEPRPAKRKAGDDDDEPRPAKKRAAADEDDDDRPARAKRRPADEDEEEKPEEDTKAKKGKRGTPWYVLLPLLLLSFSGLGIGMLWSIGFTWLDLDRKVTLSTESKEWIGIGVAVHVTVFCLIFAMLPNKTWLRFLLVIFVLALGYGESFAIVYWWTDTPFGAEKPNTGPMPAGGPQGAGMQAPGGGGGAGRGGGMPPGGRGGQPPGGRGGQPPGGQGEP